MTHGMAVTLAGIISYALVGTVYASLSKQMPTDALRTASNYPLIQDFMTSNHIPPRGLAVAVSMAWVLWLAFWPLALIRDLYVKTRDTFRPAD